MFFARLTKSISSGVMTKKDGQLDGVCFYYKEPNSLNVPHELLPQSLRLLEDIFLYSICPHVGFTFAFVSAFDEKDNFPPTVLYGNLLKQNDGKNVRQTMVGSATKKGEPETDQQPIMFKNLIFQTENDSFVITFNPSHNKLNIELEKFMVSKEKFSSVLIPGVRNITNEKHLSWTTISKDDRRAENICKGIHLVKSWVGGLLQIQYELSTVAVQILDVVVPKGNKGDVIRNILKDIRSGNDHVSDAFNISDTFWMYWPMCKPPRLETFLKQLWQQKTFSLQFLQIFWNEQHPLNSGFYLVHASETAANCICLYWMHPITNPEYEVFVDRGVLASTDNGRKEEGFCILESQCQIVLALDDTNQWSEACLCPQKSQFFIPNVIDPETINTFFQFDGYKLVEGSEELESIEKRAVLWDSVGDWGVLKRLKKTGYENLAKMGLYKFDEMFEKHVSQ